MPALGLSLAVPFVRVPDTGTPAADPFLLLESGDYFLLESGDKLIL